MARTIRRKNVKFKDYIEHDVGVVCNQRTKYLDQFTNITLSKELLISLGINQTSRTTHESFKVFPFPIPFHRLDKCNNTIPMNIWVGKNRWKRNVVSLEYQQTKLKTPTTSFDYSGMVLEQFYVEFEQKFHSDSKKFLTITEVTNEGRFVYRDNTFYKHKKRNKHLSKLDDLNLGLDEYYLLHEPTLDFHEDELTLLEKLALWTNGNFIKFPECWN